MSNYKIDDYLNQLNAEQKEAATLSGGSAIVLAAAGAGKTSTLTCRIANLIDNMGVSASHILAVTFTNKAAKEMISRLNKMGVDTKPLWVGTFHGICNKILRSHASLAGLQKSFTIMDSSEQESFFKRMLRANDYDPKNVNVSELLSRINGYKEVGWRSNQLKINSQERTIYSLYEKACKNDNVVDFGELMLSCYEILMNNPEILDYYSDKFEHILVDEFQDTNELQYKWLKLLASKHKNIFAVGDDDQCLLEGTLIKTAKGQIPIEDIEVGDMVICKAGKHFFEKPVLKKFQKTDANECLEIVFENGTKVTSTPEHNWFALLPSNEVNQVNHEDVNDFVHAGKNVILTLCNEVSEDNVMHLLEYYTNSQEVIEKISSIGLTAVKQGSYNYKVIFTSVNFADIQKKKELLSELIEGLQFIYKAKFDGLKFMQLSAKELTPSMIMVGDSGERLVIKEINRIKTNKSVYDIDVADLHNFFANGVLSHNSIYGFRGAKPENINLLKQDFSAKIIKIEKNYRSDANVLIAANAIISNNTNRQGKNLVPTKPAKNKISFYEAFNDIEESNFIANEVKNFRRKNVPYKNMCVLYRTNGQSRSLEKALNAQNIPYIIYGGFRFFDRQEVKHAMAYLRLAINPNDNLAFLRVANIPVRSIGTTALNNLELFARQSELSLYTASQVAENKLSKKMLPFIELIDHLHTSCKNLKLPDMVKKVIIDSGLEEMYEKDKKEGPERLDNLYELISAAEVFASENTGSNIDEFLAFSSLESDYNSEKRNDQIDALKLMTVHSSKGLEFDNVFISGLEETLFPHANSIGDPAQLEEERRLMYVALTRAKENLFISFSEERLLHGQKTRMVRSRFFKELPANIMQKIK